jgi:hypothetical protein
MLTGLFLAAAATMVPPGEAVVDHSQPYHYTQPTIRRFVGWQDDMNRRLAWEAYCDELRELWSTYRQNNSTPEAFFTYKRAAAEAKRRYVYGDPWLAPVHNPDRDRYLMQQN